MILSLKKAKKLDDNKRKLNDKIRNLIISKNKFSHLSSPIPIFMDGVFIIDGYLYDS